MFNINSIPYDDVRTWDLLKNGYTDGVFQCESKLVQEWLRKIKPNNIWELSAVIALVRPGPLKSGFTNEYLDYRNQEKEFVSFGHPIIDEVFAVTDHILCYQEQVLSLGLRLAWPHLEEKEKLIKVDTLRKAVGKKDQEKLLKIGKEFVEGCQHNGLDKELADKLFEIIKNCGRYLFNLSHSIAYAYIAYQTAYLKVHYPLQFFATYLTYSQFKIDAKEEVYKFIKDCRFCGIDIIGPNINRKNKNFCIYGNKICFGLDFIKHTTKSFIEQLDSIPYINDWRQVILLTCTDAYGFKVNSRTSVNLIIAGAFCDTKIPRKDLLALYELTRILTDRELKWVVEHIEEIETPEDYLKLISSCAESIANKNRKKIIESHIQLCNLNNYDHPSWIENAERNSLGCPITTTSIEGKSYISSHSCVDCKSEDIPLWSERKVAAIIGNVKYTKTKTGSNPGQSMAIIDIYDTSGSLEKLPVFPEQYQTYMDYVIENNTLLFHLKKGKGGWIIEHMEKI